MIAAQAFLVTRIGLFVGARFGATIQDTAERAAGVALLGLGSVLLIERLS